MRGSLDFTVIVAVLVSCQAAAAGGVRELPIWFRGTPFPMIEVAPDLPESDRSVLDRLNRALRDAAADANVEPDDLRLGVSPGGTAITMYEEPRPCAEPPVPGRVWVWPNWREPDRRVSIKSVVRPEFLSDRHLLVKREERCILILDGDDRCVALPEDLTQLRMLPTGRWWALSRGDRTVVLEGEEVSAEWFDRPRRTDMGTAPLVTIEVTADGRLLALGTPVGLGLYDLAARRLIRVYEDATLHSMEPWQGEVVFVRIGGKSGLLDLSNPDEPRFLPESWPDRERPWGPSPRGRVIFTWQDTLVPGGVKLRVRAMPGVETKPPSLEAAEPILPGDVVGWLSF